MSPGLELINQWKRFSLDILLISTFITGTIFFLLICRCSKCSKRFFQRFTKVISYKNFLICNCKIVLFFLEIPVFCSRILYVCVRSYTSMHRRKYCYIICLWMEISHEYKLNYSTQVNTILTQLCHCVSYIFWQISRTWLSNLWCSAPIINNMQTH